MSRSTVFAVAAGLLIGVAFALGSSKPPEASGESDPTAVKPGDPAGKPIAKDEPPAAKAKFAALEASVGTVVVSRTSTMPTRSPSPTTTHANANCLPKTSVRCA